MRPTPIPAVALAVVSCAALALSGGATVALADAPVVTTIDMTFAPFTATDLCAFPVTIVPTQTGTEKQYFNKRGIPTHTDFHTVEVDTFTNATNGVTLQGSPFVNQQRVEFDAAGIQIHAYESA